MLGNRDIWKYTYGFKKRELAGARGIVGEEIREYLSGLVRFYKSKGRVVYASAIGQAALKTMTVESKPTLDYATR